MERKLTGPEIAQRIVERGPRYDWSRSSTREVMRGSKVKFARALELRFAERAESHRTLGPQYAGSPKLVEKLAAWVAK
jgi:hypothetical protein